MHNITFNIVWCWKVNYWVLLHCNREFPNCQVAFLQPTDTSLRSTGVWPFNLSSEWLRVLFLDDSVLFV